VTFEFVAADLPEVNTMTVGVMAVLAHHEREAIDTTTKVTLAAAAARGKKLSGPRPGTADISRFQRRGVQATQEKAAERRGLVIGTC
jgi:DNA invertase Pin-like site-specific DNA recombinase